VTCGASIVVAEEAASYNGRQRLHMTIGTVPLMADRLVPGMRVRHPSEPLWGIGQVQSVIGDRITVNFENAGKLLINGALVQLVLVEDDRDG
jgi:hypothetical protein